MRGKGLAWLEHGVILSDIVCTRVNSNSCEALVTLSDIVCTRVNSNARKARTSPGSSTATS